MERSQIDSQDDVDDIESKFFVKILYEKFETCFITLINHPDDYDYCRLIVKYIKSLSYLCTMDNNTFSNSFKQKLEENWFYDGKFIITNSNMEYALIELLKLACELNLNKMLLLKFATQIRNTKQRRIFIQKVCNKFVS